MNYIQILTCRDFYGFNRFSNLQVILSLNQQPEFRLGAWVADENTAFVTQILFRRFDHWLEQL